MGHFRKGISHLVHNMVPDYLDDVAAEDLKTAKSVSS